MISRLVAAFFTVISMPLLFSACGNHDSSTDKSKVADQKQAHSQQQASNNLTYEFNETGNGLQCSTGRRSFGSLVEMCMKIQDSDENENCALSERTTFYNERCSYLGLGSFQSSFECTFTLIKNGAPSVTNGWFNSSDVIDSMKLCAGHAPNGIRIAGLSAERFVWHGMAVDASISSNDSGSSFSMTAYPSVEERSSSSRLFPEILVESPEPWTTEFGHLNDSSGRQFVASCRNVWACEY